MIKSPMRIGSVALLVTGLLGLVDMAQGQYAPRYTNNATARVNGASPRQVVSGASMSGLQMGLASFRADMGRMPRADEGLLVLIQRPPGAKNWRGPYIATNNWRAAFADPWGMQYRYIVTPAGGNRYMYTIASNGPDRVANTRDDLSVQF